MSHNNTPSEKFWENSPKKQDFIWISLENPQLRSLAEEAALLKEFKTKADLFKKYALDRFFRNAGTKFFGVYSDHDGLRHEIKTAMHKIDWQVCLIIPHTFTASSNDFSNMVLMTPDDAMHWTADLDDNAADFQRGVSDHFRFKQPTYPLLLPRGKEDVLQLPLVNDKGTMVYMPMPIKSRSQLVTFGLREAGRAIARSLRNMPSVEDLAEQQEALHAMEQAGAIRQRSRNREHKKLHLLKSAVREMNDFAGETLITTAELIKELPVVPSTQLTRAVQTSLPTVIITPEQRKLFLLQATRDLLHKQFKHAKEATQHKVNEAEKIVTRVVETARKLHQDAQAHLEIKKLNEKLAKAQNEKAEIEKNIVLRTDEELSGIERKIKKLTRKIEKQEKRLYPEPNKIAQIRKQLRKDISKATQRQAAARQAIANQRDMSWLFQHAADELADYKTKHPTLQPLSEQEVASLWGLANRIVSQRTRTPEPIIQEAKKRGASTRRKMRKPNILPKAPNLSPWVQGAVAAPRKPRAQRRSQTSIPK